jgi:FkbM family methyltransferase
MLITASKAIKEFAPSVHKFAKRVFRWSKLPALKLLDGKFTFVAPDLFSVAPTEPHILKWIEQLLHRGDIFFDVGAHYGWMSLVACHCVGAMGRVVAFEPSPPLVKFLQYHKKANRFHQMEIVPKAVADCGDPMVPFHLVDCGGSSLNSLIDHRSESNTGLVREKATIQVETLSLDEYCKITNLRPQLVKIDVEGAELLVLQGSKRLLGECRPTFIVAVHPMWMPENQSAAELFELFRVHGYKVGDSKVVQYGGAETGDYLFLPSAYKSFDSCEPA